MHLEPDDLHVGAAKRPAEGPAGEDRAPRASGPDKSAPEGPDIVQAHWPRTDWRQRAVQCRPHSGAVVQATLRLDEEGFVRIVLCARIVGHRLCSARGNQCRYFQDHSPGRTPLGGEAGQK